MEANDILLSALAYLSAAVIAVPLFKRLGLGSVLGYLAAGSAVGPWGLRLITHVESIMHIAELGVVMLLFVIGLELKPSRLWGMRHAVLGTGGAQVVLTSLLFGFIAYACGLAPLAAGVLGISLSLSSTAFALQMLGEKNQLNTEHGRASLGVLLFQDLVAIPLLAIVPLLGTGAGPADPSAPGPAMAIGRAILVVAAIVLAGRFIVRHAFRVVANSNAKEIFTAASLLVVLGTAQILSVLGLSMALGAFLAGVLLSESEYRHELEADIEPFKGLLLGLFFVSVGMSVDYGLLAKEWALILALTVGVLFCKWWIVYGLGRLKGLDNISARAMAFVLPQGGEFSFVLFSAAVAAKILTPTVADVMIIVVTLTMALTPGLGALHEAWCRYRCPNREADAEFDRIESEDNPVIVAGFGRVGQVVGRMLRVQDIGYTALEQDSSQVEVLRRFGQKIYYGDASRLDLLESAGAARAKLFVLAIDDVEKSLRTVDVVRENFPRLKILARARNRQHAYELMDRGVQIIHRETLDSSLSLVHDVLQELGFASATADNLVAKFKAHDQQLLLEQHRVHHNENELIATSKLGAEQLRQVLSSDQAVDFDAPAQADAPAPS